MMEFNQLVADQVKTMDKLLFLESEIERCQKLEAELAELQQLTEVQSVTIEINQMKEELKAIQSVFQEQTEQIVLTYQQEKLSV
ncbi:YgaB family protein [Bacillus seohaeanensis]|uniref:YgaB family protein n=1 Tax=Bacillus seohaeanensis TaxID=284580 RepID=A0ABW5RPX7_9BACI